MNLEKSRKDLRILVNFLRKEIILPDLENQEKYNFNNLNLVSLKITQEQNLANKANPRNFCAIYFQINKFEITCAANLDSLPQEHRLGILLHELGHIISPDKEEEIVDCWCYAVSRKNYEYKKLVNYKDIFTGNVRLAKNLEAITGEFKEYLLEYYS